MLYLLHGRGDSMAAWTQVKSRLDELIGSGEIPPTIAVMPDAPWSSRASYYVDSAYTGADPGRPVETAFFRDLVPHVDASYRTIADRNGRAVAGYSMGGAGALRYAMAHPEVFGASIALSPAVYFPLPPADSSAREFGAFGKGKDPFSEAVYLRLNYPAAFKSFAATGLPSHLFIAVGDDEWKNPKPADYTHDLDFEAHVVFNQAVRVPNLTSEFRVVDGGHDWDVWGPTFADGAKYIFQYIGKPPAVPMKATVTGTAGEDRAGGIATDASGNVYQAAAVEGSLDGSPYAGGKDVALTKYAPDGTREWTRSIGTSGTERAYGVAIDSQGRVVVTGYTTGNLDGAHAGNTTDDAFAVQYDAAGNQRWIRQFGVPGRRIGATRWPSMGTRSTSAVTRRARWAERTRVTRMCFSPGWTARVSRSGFGRSGVPARRRAWRSRCPADAVYLAGMTAGALGTSAGGVDGFITRYSVDGDAMWLKQFGTSASDEVVGTDGRSRWWCAI